MPTTTRRAGASSSRVGGPILAPDGGPYPIGDVDDVAVSTLVLLTDVITTTNELRTKFNALLALMRAVDILED